MTDIIKTYIIVQLLFGSLVALESDKIVRLDVVNRIAAVNCSEEGQVFVWALGTLRKIRTTSKPDPRLHADRRGVSSSLLEISWPLCCPFLEHLKNLNTRKYVCLVYDYQNRIKSLERKLLKGEGRQ